MTHKPINIRIKHNNSITHIAKFIYHENIFKQIDLILIILSIVALFIQFVSTDVIANATTHVVGAVGFIYCLVCILVGIFNPVERDWVIVKGNFLKKVVCFVPFLPFVITFSISVFTSGNFSPKNLVYKKYHQDLSK